MVDSNGDVNSPKLFDRYGLSLEGPITDIENRLKTFVASGSQGWLYATVDFGGVPNGHTINLSNVRVDSSGKVGFDVIGTSDLDWDRNYGINSNNLLKNYYKLSQLYIVTRKK